MELLSYRLYRFEQEHPKRRALVMRLLKTHEGLLKCLRVCEIREHGIRPKVYKHN